jgi:hypothetical protein
MLKLLWRGLFGLGVVTLIVALVLLLNITAPNPTRRRYSSEMPLTTRQGTANQIGFSAENILSKDLGLPRNDDPGERRYVCNTAGVMDPSSCNSCFVTSPAIATFRRPDFVGKDFIAESKNATGVLYESRDFAQITDFVAAATVLRVPLWVYVRVNTSVPPDLEQQVSATGGGVVHYFSVPNYRDPVDGAAIWWRDLALIVMAVTGAAELVHQATRSRRTAPPPTPSPAEAVWPDAPINGHKRPQTPLTRAERSVQQAAEASQSFRDAAKDRLN